MTTEDGQNFLFAATNYCHLIESLDSLEEKNLDNLLSSLVELYKQALTLPEVETEEAGKMQVDIPLPVLNLGSYEYYWELFEPYRLEEPVCASLADDLIDIYKDLKEGVVLHEQNLVNDAIWHWKFYFEAHWGSHLVDGLRTLHAIKTGMAKAKWMA